MEFTLPAEHRHVRDAVREFCTAEIAPIAQEIEDDARFPAELFDRLGDIDVLGVPIDERWGGLGGDQLMYAVVCEELGRVSGAVGLSLAAHTSLGSTPIERFGSDASDMDTTAVREGDGYVLDGIKRFITNGSVAGSVLVKAVTDSTAGSRRSSSRPRTTAGKSRPSGTSSG